MSLLSRTAGTAGAAVGRCCHSRASGAVTRCLPSTSSRSAPRAGSQRAGLHSYAHNAAGRGPAHSRALRNTPAYSRSLHTSPARLHGHLTRPAPGTGIKVTFNDSKGNHLKTVEVNEGDNLLDIAHEHDIDLEGACEGSIACSTCHVILRPEDYDKLEEPSDDENDMLDMAFGLTDTSRLGCQVKVRRDLDGLVATLPSATRNMFVDGAKPKH